MNDLKQQLVSFITCDVRFVALNAFLAGYFLSTLRIPGRKRWVYVTHFTLGVAQLIMMCVMMMLISSFLVGLSH